MNQQPFFFIIGRPRSGTTLLRLLFEAHPNIIIPPESPFIIVLYKKYQHIKVWNEQVINEFLDDLYQVRYFDKWLLKREELYENLLQLKGETTFQEIVLQVYRNYKSVYEKKEILMIGDKNPMYSLYPERIHKLYPESKIIHITRDYRDNYLSLVNVNFEVPIVPIVVYRWKFALKKMWALKKANPDLIYSLRYEDLVEDPEFHTRKLCEFLEIEFDHSVLDFYKKKEEAETVYAPDETVKRIHQSLFNPISKERMDKWKTDMTARQIKVADTVAGKAGEKAGYVKMYPGTHPWLKIWIMPSLIYASVMYRLIRLGDHFPYNMRNSLNKSLGIFLKVYWKLNKRKVKPI